MQGVKHELEASKTNETNFYKENDRLAQLIDLKRPSHMKANTSFGQSAELANAAAAHVAFKPSLSSNNIRSATPKGKQVPLVFIVCMWMSVFYLR